MWMYTTLLIPVSQQPAVDWLIVNKLQLISIAKSRCAIFYHILLQIGIMYHSGTNTRHTHTYTAVFAAITLDGRPFFSNLWLGTRANWMRSVASATISRASRYFSCSLADQIASPNGSDGCKTKYVSLVRNKKKTPRINGCAYLCVRVCVCVPLCPRFAARLALDDMDINLMCWARGGAVFFCVAHYLVQAVDLPLGRVAQFALSRYRPQNCRHLCARAEHRVGETNTIFFCVVRCSLVVLVD